MRGRRAAGVVAPALTLTLALATSACQSLNTPLYFAAQSALEAGGQELRMFPSTRATASVAGFVAGGSGGVGSISWGGLRDFGNVIRLRVLTMEETPRALLANPHSLRLLQGFDKIGSDAARSALLQLVDALAEEAAPAKGALRRK